MEPHFPFYYLYMSADKMIPDKKLPMKIKGKIRALAPPTPTPPPPEQEVPIPDLEPVSVKPKAKVKVKVKPPPPPNPEPDPEPEDDVPPGSPVETVFHPILTKVKAQIKAIPSKAIPCKSSKAKAKSIPSKAKAKAESEDDDYDPIGSDMPGPGFNLSLKEHTKPKLASTYKQQPTYVPPHYAPPHYAYEGVGVGLSNKDWHALYNVIPNRESVCDKPDTLSILSEPVSLTEHKYAPRHPKSVVPNVYKPSTLERELFSQMMADQVYYMTEDIPYNNIQLNNSKEVMKHMKQFRTQLQPDWESSIYIRGSENSMSSYLFVIAGPRDTPYDNGLFLYNMELPINYPSSPPNIRILSTGSGRYRVNPNLYADGKVCLDLLGTFGYSWSSRSNMVQVLLAIQAQIMVEMPLRNEPVYNNTGPDTPSNIIYNALQRIITMKVAMITPMIDPYIGFNDLICKFFFGPKRLEIIQQMYTWVEAAKLIKVSDCAGFLGSSAYNYTSSFSLKSTGAGAGVGILPYQKMTPEQLRDGIIEMTKSHASKVLSLLYARVPGLNE